LDSREYHGPLFHRWLPDGEKDAIHLDVKDVDAKLKIWFERCGFVNGNFIKFDDKRREIDPGTMSRQAILDGGPLIGLLKIQMPDKELAALRKSKVGDPKRISLGKRVIKIIQGPVTRFLSILRTTYGQYWLPELKEWDSRSQTLGHYCNSPLNLEWSFDSGKNWSQFVPEKLVVILRLSKKPDFGDYLTKADWQLLAKTTSKGNKTPLSAFLITQAREYLELGDLRHALVEGVSALEVALDNFIRQNVNASDDLTKSVQAIFNIGLLQARVVAVISALNVVSLADLELTVKAIDMRNKVVHEAWNPSESAGKEINGLLRTAAALLPGPRFKFPTLWYGNVSKATDEWERLEKKSQRS
jgi:hypothetical protein